MIDERVITNKHGRQWIIPEGAKGTPIEKAWSDRDIPDELKGAVIYEIDGQQIIAKQQAK